MIKLFDGEKIVSQSEHRLVELTLTSHRISYEYSVWGNSYNQNIALEHITSCENKYTSQIVFAIVSVGCLIFGLSIGTEISIVIGFVLFLVFAIIYVYTKQNNIIIGSPSTKMKIDVKGMKNETIIDFINLIEETKYKRILSIK
jgi:glucan phosphoethanolaminetransferase (alkaline phosphatase superfamily)